MPSKEEVIEALRPLAHRIRQLDLSDREAAMAEMNRDHPIATLDAVRALLCEASEEGWLTPRRATPTLTFGRLAKATETTHDLSIDIVDMTGAGPGHTHPKGEVNLCFALDGQPTFMGHPEGWVVEQPGSHHVPTVAGGRMLIAYFLPDGAMEFD
ncbi:MAG: DUF4863 family protein [Myxococcales bacterium]|nr:DUF4863 family protein [Myxococcales bacterium]